MRLMPAIRPPKPRRLLADNSGLALIEFAFVLPFLLTIAMVGVETARLAITVLRLNQIAMLAADNAARVRTSIDEADVNELMVGLNFAGNGIELGDYGRVIVSTLESNGKTGGNAGYKITWQRCYGSKNVTSSYGLEGAGASNATMSAGMGPAGQKIKPVNNTALIFAEVRYDYHPLIAPAFMGEMELSALQSFPVRDRPAQTLTNNSSLTNAQKRLCDAQHLAAT